jgi:translocation and assembly module TamA
MLFRHHILYFLYAAILVITFYSNAGSIEKGVGYETVFKGISDKDLLTDIQSISDSYNIEHEMESIYLLQKMADSDIKKFLQLLKSRGFYNASVKSEIDTKADPQKLLFIFETGNAFVLKSVKLEFSGIISDDAPKLPSIKSLGLVLNMPFSSEAVLDAQDELIRIIRSRGFPFVKISDREVIVDHQDQSVSVTFYIDPGQKAFFGPTKVSGLTEVDESYVKGKIPWKEGDAFNGNLIEELRKEISGLGIFASVIITEGKDVDSMSRISTTIEVTERKHRSLSAGLKYLTDEGPGARLSWENRNIFHKGERLSTSLDLSKVTTASETGFRKEDFLLSDQDLRLSLKLSDYHPEAYQSRSVISSGYIDRDLTKIFSLGGGLVLKTSSIEQLDSVESYYLFSLPLYFEMDKTSDLLDPVIGDRLSLQFIPYHQISGARATFGKALLSYKRYVRVSRKPLVVIAAALKASVLKGASRDDIPADERLYSGGGGSIRGYEYQTVGPLSEGVPIGGKSLFESSLEVRLKLSERFGLVAFLDGGTAYAEKLFSGNYPLKWGTGLGFRYYTPVGPFRLDIGIPLDKRKGIDKSYQIYISLGQAF